MSHTAKPQTLLLLAEADWQARERRHIERVSPTVNAHLARASRREKHPVYNFLWEYYSFRPAHLLRWSPGVGVGLEGEDAQRFLSFSGYRSIEGVVSLDPAAFTARRRSSAQWVLELLKAIEQRPARFGCFGLHEWAMVYRDPKRRHAGCPLRLDEDCVNEVVDNHRLVCSHFDAYRFFTEKAVPLNTLKPGPTTRRDMEQKGCVHVNMDLYKWAYKFYPWISSELIADTFLFASKARELDMRASPYDLTELGFRPIAIETEDGRLEYQRLQTELSLEAEPIRSELIGALVQLLEFLSDEDVDTTTACEQFA